MTTELYGEQIPFCEPYWYQGGFSPYYTDAHTRFRHVCREFCEKEIKPHLDEWIAKKEYPQVARSQPSLSQPFSPLVRCSRERPARPRAGAAQEGVRGGDCRHDLSERVCCRQTPAPKPAWLVALEGMRLTPIAQVRRYEACRFRRLL